MSDFTLSALLLGWTVFLILTDLIWVIFHPDPRKSDPKGKLRFQTITFLCMLSGFVIVYSIKILRMQTHVRTKQLSIGNLGALPYADLVPAMNNSHKSGVTLYKPGMCFPGLNLFAQRDHGEAYLMNIEGKIVHSWFDRSQNSEDWSSVIMSENGDLIALAGNHYILKLDRGSNTLWKKEMRCHHDIVLDEEGNIWTLLNEDKVVTRSFVPISILDNSIAMLTPDGNITEEIPLYDKLKHLIPNQSLGTVLFHIPLRYPGMIRSWFARRFFFNADMKLDILHTNSVTVLDSDIEGLCKKGDILISIRELNTIAAMDRHSKKIIWAWGPGEIDKQHHATRLDNGNILLFDNGSSRGFSRVVEVNPLSKKIEWEYKDHPPENFFSATRGGCQRLPNGNTLITESDSGRAFEVTREGEMVWEFFTPTVTKKNGIMRSAIYRMTRIWDAEGFF